MPSKPKRKIEQPSRIAFASTEDALRWALDQIVAATLPVPIDEYDAARVLVGHGEAKVVRLPVAA